MITERLWLYTDTQLQALSFGDDFKFLVANARLCPATWLIIRERDGHVLAQKANADITDILRRVTWTR